MTAPLTVAAIRLCPHDDDPATCDTCALRAAIAASVGLPDLAAGLGGHPDATPCGCCPLPIEPGEPTGTTPGGETVHAGCAR